MHATISSRTTAALEPSRRRGRATSAHGLPLRLDGRAAATPVIAEWSARRVLGKRLFDLALSLAALLVLGPALLLLALAVKLSGPGPVLFRQWRVGRNGVPFQIIKFRTMRHDRCDASGLQQAVPDDERVTPLGAFMRARSLDELPQLLNVLRGEMSLIGPRPHAIGMHAAGMPYEELVPYYESRHVVRPGMSGWAQANGLRGPTIDARAARARIDHDIAYIQNQSLLLDLRIIALTLRNEFLTGSGC